jgi:pimeloyl-ACP methyl ester carboxylesterase
MSNIVLVHGGWCTGWTWQEVAARLARQGHQVTAIEQLPSGGHDPAVLGDLAADAEYVRAVIAQAPADVILVGHSYGGMVVTELADHPRVRHTVYVTGFWPDQGQSLMDIRSEHEREWVIYREDGILHVTDDMETAHYMMAGDLDGDRFADFYARRVLQSAASFTAPSTGPERAHPATYVLCDKDRSILPADQERMARKADQVCRIGAAHMSLLSAPVEVADAIHRAAAM